MLSRVAENLFWIGRYIERAENVARLVDVGRRMSALPRDIHPTPSNEWSSILIAAGSQNIYERDIERADMRSTIDHLFFDPSVPSSVYNSFHYARENGRAIRTALTQDCWEALNSAWTGMRDLPRERASGAALADIIDWIKSQSALFRGAFHGTMVRDDGYEFIRMGMAIERVDSTARLLDVKYHVLLADISEVGSGADHYQWLSLLQASAGQRAYAFLTKSPISARGVAQFLILADRFPRAIRFNVQLTADTVASLERFYGKDASCHERVQNFLDRVTSLDIEAIFSFGLHEFLTDVIERNYAVADGLAEAYGFAPILTDDGAADETGGQ
ncbi:MAG: alpha-E domain-containing protein [Hyphomonadaceae bacterium]